MYAKGASQNIDYTDAEVCVLLELHIWIPLTGCVGLIVATQVGVPLRILWGYSSATACTVAPFTVAAEYTHSTLNCTPTCRGHNNTALYESHITVILPIQFFWFGKHLSNEEFFEVLFDTKWSICM